MQRLWSGRFECSIFWFFSAVPLSSSSSWEHHHWSQLNYHDLHNQQHFSIIIIVITMIFIINNMFSVMIKLKFWQLALAWPMWRRICWLTKIASRNDPQQHEQMIFLQIIQRYFFTWINDIFQMIQRYFLAWANNIFSNDSKLVLDLIFYK